MKKTNYFSHDSNAREDPKIVAMRSVYGWEGYGYYWMLVESMREQSNYRLSTSGEYVWNAFAMQMQCDVTKAKKFIEDCIEQFGLFKSNKKEFWSESLLKRMNVMEEKSKKASESAKARWNKGSVECERNANALPTQSEPNANGMQIKETKVKEKKGKEIIYTAKFEEFYAVYPNQYNREQTFKNWKSRVEKGVSEDDLIIAAKNYADEVAAKGTEPQYVVRSTNFLGQKADCMAYLPSVYVKEENIKAHTRNNVMYDGKYFDSLIERLEKEEQGVI